MECCGQEFPILVYNKTFCLSAQPNQNSAPELVPDHVTPWTFPMCDSSTIRIENELRRAAKSMSMDVLLIPEHMFVPSKARQALCLASIHARCLSRSNSSAHQCPCGCSKFQPGLSSFLSRRQLSIVAFQNGRAVTLEQNTRYAGPKRSYASVSLSKWATETEKTHTKLIEAAEARVNVYKKVMENVRMICDFKLCVNLIKTWYCRKRKQQT